MTSRATLMSQRGFGAFKNNRSAFADQQD